MILRLRLKGGPGSGHRGHGGRPGKRGGSSPGTGAGQLALDKFPVGSKVRVTKGDSAVRKGTAAKVVGPATTVPFSDRESTHVKIQYTGVVRSGLQEDFPISRLEMR